MPEETFDLTRTVTLPSGETFTLAPVPFGRLAELIAFLQPRAAPLVAKITSDDPGAPAAAVMGLLTDPATFAEASKLAEGSIVPALDPDRHTAAEGVRVLLAWGVFQFQNVKDVLLPFVAEELTTLLPKDEPAAAA
jgi:hypothetical protein